MPPPFGLLCLAAYLEAHFPELEIEVMDCQAEDADWNDVVKRIASYQPDVVAPSTLSSCNADITLQTVSIAKNVDASITTVVGGQHFSVLAQEALEENRFLDFVVRGEGETTLLELVRVLESGKSPKRVKGLALREGNEVILTPARPQLKNLDTLPFPGYHFVREHMSKYTFPAGKNLPYALVEGSRGCSHSCSFCTQWRYWGNCRRKSPKRVADEFEYLYDEFGSRFLWLTDDYIRLDAWMDELCDELIKRKINKNLMWFFQTRVDEIISGKELLPKLRKNG
ncbi:MAG: B12-binding domain-containing radical SAM protein, partial [Candidatus Thorarchaeota archaeon]